ncbi:MAG: CARDB domain-containing protein [Candidatus Cloacimonetes bacterium]|nr:CARDB domain-containing protein [Candidatus Cloacimonadota bacterium]
MKHLSIIFLLLIFATAAFAQITWTGALGSYWNVAGNWSPAVIPTAGSNVTIPNTTNKPYVTADAICNSLIINPGATLYVHSSYSLTVTAILDQKGTLNMSGTGNVDITLDLNCYGLMSVTGTGALTVYRDAYWYSGSSLIDSNSTKFNLYRDLYIYDGASFIMNHGGRLTCLGSENSNIHNNSALTQFGYLKAAKSASSKYVNIHADSTQPFKINQDLENSSNNKFFCSKNITVTILGVIYDWNSADTTGNYGIKWNAGTILLDGTIQYLDLQGPGSYLNHLICSATSGVISEFALTIKGNLTIQSGYLSVDNYSTITIAGSWDNQMAPNGFIEGEGRVIFNSPDHQSILSNETFNILEVANGNALRFASGKTVTCAKYDWTSGGIDMNTNATFTANDLAEAGIFGNWWLTNLGGVINLTNENVDLKGNFNITSGVFNVYGGGIYNSTWNSYDYVTLNMSGGTLDFHDTGIYVYNLYASSTPTHMTLNISGGTIKTSQSIENTWDLFATTGGTFEFYGNVNAILGGMLGGFHHLKINKTAASVVLDATIPLSLGGNLTISSGTLQANNHVVTCANAYITGTLAMNNKLDCLGEIKWNNGCLAAVADNSIIECGSNWYIGSTANVQLNNTVKVYFKGTGTKTITILKANQGIGYLRIGLDSSGNNYAGGVYSVAASSSADLMVTGSLVIRAENTLDLNQRGMSVSSDMNLGGTLIIDSGTVTVNGLPTIFSTGVINLDTGTLHLVNHELLIPSGAVVSLASGTIKSDGITALGSFQPAGGKVILSSTNSGVKRISLAAGNWFPNLTIAAPSRSYYLGSDITIKKDFIIDSGLFSVENISTGTFHTMYVGENWWNNQGPDNFWEGFGRVVFNGGGFQAIKTSETFNIIEVAKIVAGGGGDALRIESGTAGEYIVVNCAKYDWTSGDLDVNLRATMNINDLVDNGMYGGFYCAETGILNITQDAAQNINLYGRIQVTGGTMNIYGGSGIANWAGSSASNVKITSGALHYHNQGLEIRNTYALTYDISGGTISTAGTLSCNRTDFIPVGGTFEMRGNTDTLLDFQTAVGSSLYNLTINKANLGNQVSQATNTQTIRGQMIIDNGSYYMINRTLNCLGNLTVNDSAKLYCYQTNTVKMAAGKTINVNNGGWIEANGLQNDTRVTFTHVSDGYYNFNVQSGGSLLANFAIFEYTGADGVYIKPGASTTGPHDSIFRNGVVGGVLLRMDSSEDKFISNVDFPTNAGGSSKNVWKSVDAGNVYFRNYSGSFGGAGFENDPNHRVFWLGSDVNLQITNVSWSRPDNYVCAPLTATITVKNFGLDYIESPFRVDLYKNSATAPVEGTMGDFFQEIANLDGGQSKVLTFNNISTDIPGIWRSWIRVDTEQHVVETNETDNLWSAIPNTSWLALPPITDLTMTHSTVYNNFELLWASYPISVSRFKIYGSTDPYFIPSSGTYIGQTPYGFIHLNPDSLTTRQFYIIQAERDLPTP